MTGSFARHTFLVACTIAFAACAGGDEGSEVPLAQAGAQAASDSAAEVAAAHAMLGPEAQAAVDSGNALFRKQQYTPALAQYRIAAAAAPQNAAPLFGIYMVASAVSNASLADSALAEIRKRNGPLPDAVHERPGTTGKAPAVPPAKRGATG